MKMKTIQNYIVKIITPEGLGSGLIYFPSDEPEDAYVVTARHLLTKANGELKVCTDIQIIFFDIQNSVWNVTNDDVILCGSNNDSEEFAVIIIMPNRCRLRSVTQSVIIIMQIIW